MKIIPLGTTVTDSATKIKGTLHHAQVEIDGRLFYSFAPTGLHAETRKPLKSHWMVPQRISSKTALIEVELPLEILGTEVTDKESGFNGTAIAIILHFSGCVHVQIQPAGQLKTGEIIASDDFDIRRCIGPAITKLSKSERSKSEKAKPSPSPITPYSPSTSC